MLGINTQRVSECLLGYYKGQQWGGGHVHAWNQHAESVWVSTRLLQGTAVRGRPCACLESTRRECLSIYWATTRDSSEEAAMCMLGINTQRVSEYLLSTTRDCRRLPFPHRQTWVECNSRAFGVRSRVQCRTACSHRMAVHTGRHCNCWCRCFLLPVQLLLCVHAAGRCQQTPDQICSSWQFR